MRPEPVQMKKAKGAGDMNKKIADFFCDPKTALKNVALLLLMIFLLVYAFFQILPAFTQNIETETALLVSVYDTCKTAGYIFRDEKPVEKAADGVTVTLIKDGERVSKGQIFANVYSEASTAGLQEQINAIDRKIEILSKSVVDTDLYVTDITKTDQAINDDFDTLFALVANGNLADAVTTEKSLLVNLNKKTLIVNMNNGYQSEIASLQSERSALQSRINTVAKSLAAFSSGYYYGDVDGYENIFTPDKLNNLTLENFRALTSCEPDTALSSHTAGKIVTDFVWHLVCEADKYSAATFETGKYYKIRFPSFSEDTVTMKLVNSVSTTSDDTALLVFRGNTAPEGFPYLRTQEADIIGQSYSGLAVPKKALRIVAGKKGVYILDGDIVRFRLVEIIFENEDYYIVASEPSVPDEADINTETPEVSDEPTYKYLSLYDSVIVGGKDLFDGKIIA